MLSIVIPTMQKDPVILHKLLAILDKESSVSEIIVIDNSGKGVDNISKKVRVILPERNLYVNPSWNLGVKEAESEIVGILNDDIIFSKGFLSQVIEFIKYNEKVGFVGIEDLSKSDNIDNDIQETLPLEFRELEKRSEYWGIAIFFQKDKYVEIPEEMKIWCGDDYLLEKGNEAGFINYEICNSNIRHLHSLTSSRKEFDEIKYNDQRFYKTLNPDYDFKFGDSLSVGQKIFSIKNEYKNGYKYKILRFLGIKFSKRICEIV